MVLSSQVVKDVFTRGGFDNIDHNLSSTTEKTALHGTCIRIHEYQQSTLSIHVQHLVGGVEGDSVMMALYATDEIQSLASMFCENKRPLTCSNHK